MHAIVYMQASKPASKESVCRRRREQCATPSKPQEMH